MIAWVGFLDGVYHREWISRGVKSGSVENICEVLGDWTLEQSSAESVSSRVNKGGL